MTITVTHVVRCDLCKRARTIAEHNKGALKGWLNLAISQHAGPALTDVHVCATCHADSTTLATLLAPISATREAWS